MVLAGCLAQQGICFSPVVTVGAPGSQVTRVTLDATRSEGGEDGEWSEMSDGDTLLVSDTPHRPPDGRGPFPQSLYQLVPHANVTDNGSKY